jgi:hypothetical protein
MERLDLIVFVPIEHPDRVAVLDPDDAALRRCVDEKLRDIVLGDRYGFGVEAVEVFGTPEERARKVLARLL